MVRGTRSGGPQKFTVFQPDRHIVDACFPAAHHPISIEFPLLIAKRAKSMTGVVAPLILKTHGDPIFVERPKFLDQPIIEFVHPLRFRKAMMAARP
jgi:hypothetical protein